ncbi:MAG: transcription antitermination factor NusB [Candidatus Krumholzibacteriota bacterium]|nr:transcription antitermination factor NusB [Candidatus Krumholzibacteriota bacterium]
MSRRRKAREIILQTLYSIDIAERKWEEALNDTVTRRGSTDETVEYARRVLASILESRERLDSMIEGSLENWKLERVALVDRIILQIALAELIDCPEVPTGVIINEAIEIAHKFSSSKAGSFVNGILDKLAKEVRNE